jgi:tRNA A-37 threonylcarbamoyl transferase component Bud32
MKERFKLHQDFNNYKQELTNLIDGFNSKGIVFIEGKRNSIKLFRLDTVTLNIKSFRVPKFINKIVYRFFRPSKAKRSFEYAEILAQKNIGTPKPIAYFEKYDWLGLCDSYYVCEHIDFDFMIRDLIETENFPEANTILKKFAQFSFNLHENGIEFLDHSPGNTLIKRRDDDSYDFYLVDLNRMKFHRTMDFQLRMKNLRKITPYEEMIKTISEEYAQLYNKPEIEVFENMWRYTTKFQEKTSFKKKIKSLKF